MRRKMKKLPSKVDLLFNTRFNPLKIDPTRTSLIRKKFAADIRRRLRILIADVREFMRVDGLGLQERRPLAIFNVQPREFQFLTDENKLKAFNDWFRQQVDARVFSVPAGTPPNQPWMAEYVESAYRRGLMNAYLAAGGAGAIGGASAAAFLRDSFGQPVAMDKVRLLAMRTYESLRGVTATMSADMSRILSQGMIDGTSPSVLAREMSSRIQGLERTRALLIARTEIIHAHAEGNLDAYQRLGVERLGVKIEWSTAGDLRVCPQCASMEGQVFTVAEARGLIPLHPGCRCAWVPHVTE